METRPHLVRTRRLLAGRFAAMASPCEVLMETDDEALGRDLLRVALDEARRVEEKFSRYRPDSVVSRINASDGQPVEVDEETAGLLDFAARGHAMSGGLFDITTGVLRRVWTFDCSDRVPPPGQVRALLPHVGWNRVAWARPWITLPAGMQIDLGGIAKEYAVDRTLALLQSSAPSVGFLVNFGGDIAASRRRDDRPWSVGVEAPDEENRPVRLINLVRGALTTSGDGKRFLMKDGRRYGHIFDPRTGMPVESGPRSVTVMAGTCTEAGFLSTLAMLKGPDAEHVLETAGVRSWCFRGQTKPLGV